MGAIMPDVIEEVVDIGPMEVGELTEPGDVPPVRRIRHIRMELLWPDEPGLDLGPMIATLDSLVRSYGGEGLRRFDA